MTAAAFPVGAQVRVIGGALEGARGSIIDPDGGLPELPHMVRVALAGQIPPLWWIDPANLENYIDDSR